MTENIPAKTPEVAPALTDAASSSDDQPITRPKVASIAAQVYALVRACPAGRVTTYGWLAAAVGYPRGARMVGWIMNESPRWANVPAQRVINSKGELTGSWAFGQRGRMRQLLEQEGIVFNDAGRVNMKRYGWDPMRELDAPSRERILAEAEPADADVSDTLMRLLLDDPASPFHLVRKDAE
ncbi:MAG TPA: MGMT family protein [Ktedonobacterales bacterium]|nr:MGMT family protein [Ktedonobacterales bacterium]